MICFCLFRALKLLGKNLKAFIKIMLCLILFMCVIITESALHDLFMILFLNYCLVQGEVLI